MVVIDVGKGNIVEVKELKSAAKGYAQKITMKRTKEKVYYGLWKKAFETAIKTIANKNSTMVSNKNILYVYRVGRKILRNRLN